VSPSQHIRFCTSRDNVRIAYATCGSGPPLIKALHFGTHLELDWENPVWAPWLDTLARGRTLIRYDPRGCGLSDADVADFSFERHVDDLAAVADACGAERFALFGMTGGGAVSVAYAAQYPERVTALVLHGAFVRGRTARSITPEQKMEAETLLNLIELGWAKDDPAFRQLYSSQFLPEGTAEQFRSFNDLMRRSASPANAARLLRALHGVDVSGLAPRVRCPTLVLHARGDTRVPFEEGRALAAKIPNARFVPLDSRNHLLLQQEPAWRIMLAELEAFLPGVKSRAMKRTDAPFAGLTAREQEVLELVAQGADNRTIGERLGMSDKTVRNNISNILDKLGVPTRAQAIVRARDAGFGMQRRAD
jgi:pimeloyl-ACP methyl ester carboxylesterase/DNA-binding CsgD family transcriptional regulator